jgi:hypothetical protein
MDYGNSEHAKAFVAEMLQKILVDDPASHSMVFQLGVLEDQIRECLEIMKTSGQFYNDRFGKPKEHPAAKRLIALHNEYGKLYRLLSLDRPPESQQKLFE